MVTVKELKQMCKDLGYKGYSKLRKQELIDLLDFDNVSNKTKIEKIPEFTIQKKDKMIFKIIDFYNLLKKNYEEVDPNVAIYLTITIEYICTEIKDITVTNPEIDVKKDIELKKVFKNINKYDKKTYQMFDYNDYIKRILPNKKIKLEEESISKINDYINYLTYIIINSKKSKKQIKFNTFKLIIKKLLTDELWIYNENAYSQIKDYIVIN